MKRFIIDPFNAFRYWWDNERIYNWEGDQFPDPEVIQEVVGLSDAPIEVSTVDDADIAVMMLESDSSSSRYFKVVNKGEPVEDCWF